jgi:hypothetical protein
MWIVLSASVVLCSQDHVSPIYFRIVWMHVYPVQSIYTMLELIEDSSRMTKQGRVADSGDVHLRRLLCRS